MDPRLLHYYEQELRHVREVGAEFARDYPKIAGRLGLEGLECADPYVERLLESFAFLAARVQLQLDAEFPRLTQHLLEVLYPHYLAPTPSMTVVELEANPKEGGLMTGFSLPRGTALRSRIGREEATACEFRTSQKVTLWPIVVEEVAYTNVLGDLPPNVRFSDQRPQAGLRVVLRTTAGLSWGEVPVDRLPFFFSGGDAVAAKLHEQLCSRCTAVLARSDKSARFTRIAGREGIRPMGFADDEALLPVTDRSFRGYGLLHEYFSFPARYLFAEVSGLREATRGADGNRLELLLVTDKEEASLLGAVGKRRLRLFCTPAINLFPRRADRIHLKRPTVQHHVVPDRTRPMDLEVHTVLGVTGYGARGSAPQTFHPFFGADPDATRANHSAFYAAERKPRRLSEDQRRRGARSSYVGSEVFLSLVDSANQPYSHDLRQLAVELLCTNRDLPLHIPLTQGSGSDFSLQASAPVVAVHCLSGPSAPRSTLPTGDVAWRLVSHLASDYLGLADKDSRRAAAGLREMLGLYANLSDPVLVRQIAGLTSMEVGPVVRANDAGHRVSFNRGVEVTLQCDDDAFAGGSAYLLASVLARFFARHASINSFVETALSTTQRGEVARWPMQPGQRQLV